MKFIFHILLLWHLKLPSGFVKLRGQCKDYLRTCLQRGTCKVYWVLVLWFPVRCRVWDKSSVCVGEDGQGTLRVSLWCLLLGDSLVTSPCSAASILCKIVTTMQGLISKLVGIEVSVRCSWFWFYGFLCFGFERSPWCMGMCCVLMRTPWGLVRHH